MGIGIKRWLMQCISISRHEGKVMRTLEDHGESREVDLYIY